MGEVLAHDICIIFLIYGSRNLQQMTKMTFSSLLFVLEFIVRDITVFYSGYWYIAIQSVLPLPYLINGQPWTDFCVQLTLGTYTGPVWYKEVTQNGFGPCGSPFYENEEWHLLQQLSCKTDRQLSYNEKKQLHLVRRFGHFEETYLDTHSWWNGDFHGDRFLKRWCICGQSTGIHIVIYYT